MATSSVAPVAGIWAFVRAYEQDRVSAPASVPAGQAGGGGAGDRTRSSEGGGGCFGEGVGDGVGETGVHFVGTR